MHLDEKIDSSTYHTKLEEYQQRQRALTVEIKTYDESPDSSIITAKTILELARQAKEILPLHLISKNLIFILSPAA